MSFGFAPADEIHRCEPAHLFDCPWTGSRHRRGCRADIPRRVRDDAGDRRSETGLDEPRMIHAAPATPPRPRAEEKKDFVESIFGFFFGEIEDAPIWAVTKRHGAFKMQCARRAAGVPFNISAKRFESGLTRGWLPRRRRWACRG